MGAPRPRLLESLRRRLRARTAAWVRRRQGEDVLPLAITQRRVYILPTRPGVAFAVLLFVMLLAGLNYANGLALLLTFSLAGLALVAMHLCHRNLLGTVITAVHAGPAFAGEEAHLELTLGNPGAFVRYALCASLEGATPGAPLDLEPGASGALRLRLPVPRRGRVRIERLRLDTAFPFGLFEAWTWLHLPLEVIVYPAARGERRPPEHAGGRAGSHSVHGPGADEWSSLRAFRDGDSPRQVAWKAYARGAPLLVKEYSSAGAAERTFDYAALADLAPEARLEQLCRWIVAASGRGDRFDLRLPGVVLEADAGLAHRERSLRALALFGEDWDEAVAGGSGHAA